MRTVVEPDSQDFARSRPRSDDRGIGVHAVLVVDALLYRLGERVELLGLQKRQQVARRAGQDAVGAGEAAVRECDAGQLPVVELDGADAHGSPSFGLRLGTG